MHNEQITKIIENLKGRRSYEEKKASKLGFNSLYDYIEDKISKEKKVIEDKEKKFEEIKYNKDQKNKESKSCSCC